MNSLPCFSCSELPFIVVLGVMLLIFMSEDYDNTERERELDEQQGLLKQSKGNG